jgi:hypothetical protein
MCNFTHICYTIVKIGKGGIKIMDESIFQLWFAKIDDLTPDQNNRAIKALRDREVDKQLSQVAEVVFYALDGTPHIIQSLE